MDDLINCLYSFVLETRVGNSDGDRAYWSCIEGIVRQEEKVRAGMDQEQCRELNRLLSQISSQNAIENESIFRAALELARELNALVRA